MVDYRENLRKAIQAIAVYIAAVKTEVDGEDNGDEAYDAFLGLIAIVRDNADLFQVNELDGSVLEGPVPPPDC